MKTPSFRPLLLLLILSLCVYLILQISVNPELGLLPPSLSGANWITAPLGIAYANPAENGAIFIREIRLPETLPYIKTARIDVSAARSYELSLNGILLSGTTESDAKRNWKTSREFDLKPGLRPGLNRLRILVRNTVRPPAVRVTGAIELQAGGAIVLDSDSRWLVFTLDETVRSIPEGVPAPRDYYPGHWQEWNRDPGRIRALRVASTSAAYIMLLVVIVLYWRWSRSVPAPQGLGLRQNRDKLRRLIFAGLLICLYFPMAILRAPGEGWDADGHIEHLRYVASGHGIPMPHEGWEMFQPPAYYALAAIVYNAVLPYSTASAQAIHWPFPDFVALKVVQLMNPAFALFHTLIVLQLLRYLFGRPADGYTMAFVCLMPMQIYFSAFISNEVFAACTIAAALFLLVVMARRLHFGPGYSIALGLALGMACLSKYTGVLLVMTAGFVYGAFFIQRVIPRRRLLISFLTMSLVVLAVAGPFYLRNLRKYGNPMPHNSEFVKNFNIEYFDVAFFLDPLRFGIGAMDKFVSRSSSFLDGNYSSLWLDNSHLTRAWSRPFEVGIFYLAIFPTVLAGVGFLRVFSVCRSDSEEGRSLLPIVTISIFALFAYAYFILRFGSFEVVKAFYLLSQVSALAVFFEVGRRETVSDSRMSTPFAVAFMMLYGAITLYYLLTPVLIGRGL
jgi:hypothetical protein